MNNEDLWTGFGAVVSTVLSGLFWLFEIGILQTLFTFIAGALVTFFVQSRLQDRSEKRRLRVKAIEELHIPLFLIVESAKENLLLDLEPAGIGSWHQLVEKPQMFTLTHEFREQLLDFFLKSQKVASDLGSVKRIAAGIIYRNFETQLFAVLQKDGLIEIEEGAENIGIDKWKEGCGFGLQLKNPYMIMEAPISVCAILNRDPIDYLEKERRTFEIDQLILFIKINYSLGRPGARTYKDANFNIQMMEDATLFRNFWKNTIESVHEDPDVKKFNNMRLELIPISEDILSRLGNHIEKYVIREEI